ncbi:chloride channel protein [Baekduia soli]|uniref:Chloride channel protein n=1 Tax=Baekduia soli TaxID=496014 RepID=A0A5B8UC62_9ACTN|nr:chloride channel protein [Baekduia soli]
MTARARLGLSGTRGLVALALLVGVGAGLGAIAFRELIQGLTELFSGYRDYSAAGRVANPHVPGLGIWFVVLAPVMGGLLYGPLVARFAPEARGHGVPEVMLAVAEHGGRMRAQVPVIKALASALTIGSGGSVGREGPIVQIGSALGSLIGQAARVPERRLKLLVACGAAGGISATFNAPIAGVFFALEVILRDFETDSFGVVVLSSVTAAAIARGAFGSASFLHLPGFTLTSPVELVLYAALGLLGGAVGIVFIRVLYGSEDLADRLWRGPAWARPAVGGILLGLLLLAVPEMYGVGYPVLSLAVSGHYAIAFVLLLLVAKIAATSLTISIGGSGGVFAPSLFMGAMLGSAFGQVAHQLLPGVTAPAGAYALVGMGAVFAGSARAPITAVLIIFELTGEYSIILPLMLAIVLAAGISGRLSSDTIYTLKLRRRGIQIDRPRVVSVMRTVTLEDAIEPMPETLAADAPLSAAPARLTDRPDQSVPVLDALGRLVGVITAGDLEQHMMADDPPGADAGSLARGVHELHADDTLEDAVHALGATDATGLPVLTAGGREIAGWITHRSILYAYHRERRRLASAPTPTPTPADRPPARERDATPAVAP